MFYILLTVPTVLGASILFSDIQEDEWYAESVYNLSEKGIIEGYEDDTYQPSSNVNRAELATMLDRLTQYEDQQEVEKISCMNELLLAEATGSEIEEGLIAIDFSDELTESEISEILEEYSLQQYYDQWGNNNMGDIEVAPGMEYEWICLLQQDERIEIVEPSYLDYDE